MSKVKNRAVAFFNKHFVKWKFLNSMFAVPLCKDGKMYLHISQVCGNGTRVVKRTFLSASLRVCAELVTELFDYGKMIRTFLEFLRCKKWKKQPASR